MTTPSKTNPATPLLLHLPGGVDVSLPVTYWLRENAETMIRLRAWLKAGRAAELFQQTTDTTCDLAA